MDSTRRSTRHLEPKDGSSRASGVDTFRASTADSGRGSMAVSERASTADSGRGSMAISERASTGNSITAGGASSSLSRYTSLGDDYDNGHEEFHDDQPSKSNKNLAKCCCLHEKPTSSDFSRQSHRILIVSFCTGMNFLGNKNLNY